MAKNNDRVILQLQKDIKTKQSLIEKADRFSPITHCTLKIYGEVWNINVMNLEELQHIFATCLTLLNVGVNYKISGFKLSDWIEDLNSKIAVKTITQEKQRLTELENKLKQLLTNETKVSLELENIKNLI